MKKIFEWIERMNIAEAVNKRKNSQKTHPLKDVLRESKVENKIKKKKSRLR